MTPANPLILVRHGQTEWSLSGQHTGRTDIALTEAGEQQARDAGIILGRLLDGRRPARVISSPRRRALRTAELAGYPADEVTEDAAEWDYGDYEGLTSAQIHEKDPDWIIWDGVVPGGESAADVTVRVDRLLAGVRSSLADGPVLLVSHGHASRCIAARWLGEPVSGGQRFALSTGAVSSLGYEHNRPTVLHWNIDAQLAVGEDPTSARQRADDSEEEVTR